MLVFIGIVYIAAFSYAGLRWFDMMHPAVDRLDADGMEVQAFAVWVLMVLVLVGMGVLMISGIDLLAEVQDAQA